MIFEDGPVLAHRYGEKHDADQAGNYANHIEDHPQSTPYNHVIIIVKKSLYLFLDKDIQVAVSDSPAEDEKSKQYHESPSEFSKHLLFTLYLIDVFDVWTVNADFADLDELLDVVWNFKVANCKVHIDGYIQIGVHAE